MLVLVLDLPAFRIIERKSASFKVLGFNNFGVVGLS